MRVSGSTSFPDRPSLFYYITDRKQLAAGSLLRVIRRAIGWGVDLVQIREKDLCDRDVYELTRRAVEAARRTECRIIVNGRADIALAAGAHGVHLSSHGPRPSDLRAWLPRGFLVGVSAHSVREAVRAAVAGADYVLIGPVFPTESKLRYGPPLGVDYFRRACAATSAPVLALGGVHLEQVPAVLEAGAAGVAGISLFQNDAYFRQLEGQTPARNRKL